MLLFRNSSTSLAQRASAAIVSKIEPHAKLITEMLTASLFLSRGFLLGIRVAHVVPRVPVLANRLKEPHRA